MKKQYVLLMMLIIIVVGDRSYASSTLSKDTHKSQKIIQRNSFTPNVKMSSLKDTIFVTGDTIITDLKRSNFKSSRIVFIAKYPNLTFNLYNSTLINLSGISIIGFEKGKIDNISFPKGLKGTGILLAACKNFKISNVRINGSQLTAKKIGILVYRCENINVSECHTNGGEWYVSLIQIKGGEDFVVKNCSVTRVAFAQRAFYIRGDAPWKMEKSISYSKYSKFHNFHKSSITKNVTIKKCLIKDSSKGNNQAILVQEAQNITVKKCKIINSHLYGITIKRLKNGREKNFTIKKNINKETEKDFVQIINETKNKEVNFRSIKNNQHQNEHF